MELAAKTRIPFPRELAFATLRDRLADTVPFLPNVKSLIVKERKVEGTKTHLVNEWTAKVEIPSVAQSYLKPEMLMWLDYAAWDEATYSCEWALKTNVFPGLFECVGSTKLVTVGNETEMDLRGDLSINMAKAPVPRLLAGTLKPVVEKIIIAALKPNLTSVGDGVTKFLQAQAKSA